MTALQALVAGILVFTVTQAFAQDTEPEAQVRAAYDKICRAAGVKFLPGMISHRSSEFEAFGPDGREINLLAANQRLASLLTNAISVVETVEVVEVVPTHDNGLVFQVKQKLVFELRRPGGDTYQLVVNSESKDLWRKTGFGWRQTQSRILSQSAEES